MPIGIDDFGKIRNKDFYFVDKTAFIRQIIDSPREVTLITRLRRNL
ncbi:AAA family ATPase [Megasphaera elsdenii]|nr:AAA family ATPase [Megasphaera elsdenii]MCI7200009.1 AAA family ATPase [Megasphaera elsdenii]MDY4264505.1 AAA family ATPase [Megasphaera elsdenii]